MYKAIIIEDELNAALALEFLLKNHCPDIHVLEKCTSVPDGVLAINKHKPDIVFLDIEMPVYSGFDLFKFITEPEFSVIFTTAYSQYALKAFEVSAVDYLLKPIEEDALKSAVEKAKIRQDKELLLKKIQTLKENSLSNHIKKIALPISDGLAFVETETIEYIEAEGAYTRIYLKDKSQLFVSKNIKIFEEILCKDERFIRIHRSNIVNVHFFQHYNKGEGILRMQSGTLLKISRDKKQEFEDAINSLRIGR
ncbi:MAG: LytTR family DNA-binding domain-containing protein [Flavobacteriales bacterium]|nr:LytTR family DNA-binding domain-containing protein [Flavobacteriales bacterium]